MTTPPFSCFPFTALVGLDNLKLALQLAAIDRRLSVVVRGDKGAGKSTAARGLAALLDSQAPFVTLPIGATEDRLPCDLRAFGGAGPSSRRAADSGDRVRAPTASQRWPR